MRTSLNTVSTHSLSPGRLHRGRWFRNHRPQHRHRGHHRGAGRSQSAQRGGCRSGGAGQLAVGSLDAAVTVTNSPRPKTPFRQDFDSPSPRKRNPGFIGQEALRQKAEQGVPTTWLVSTLTHPEPQGKRGGQASRRGRGPSDQWCGFTHLAAIDRHGHGGHHMEQRGHHIASGD